MFHDHHYDTVQYVIQSRLKALISLKQPLYHESYRGRILVYAPHRNTFDGLAEEEIYGLFDSDDCLRWGLWVGYIQDEKGEPYVLFWVPDALIEEVNNAMEVIMLDTLRWLANIQEDWAMALQLDLMPYLSHK